MAVDIDLHRILGFDRAVSRDAGALLGGHCRAHGVQVGLHRGDGRRIGAVPVGTGRLLSRDGSGIDADLAIRHHVPGGAVVPIGLVVVVCIKPQVSRDEVHRGSRGLVVHPVLGAHHCREGRDRRSDGCVTVSTRCLLGDDGCRIEGNVCVVDEHPGRAIPAIALVVIV